MLREITGQDPIWAAPPFAADVPLFYILYRLGSYDSGVYLTDGESVFLAQTSPDRAAWIWTAENVSDTAVDETRAACDARAIGKITARPEIANRLMPGGSVCHRLYANVCEKLIPPTHVDGELSRPTAGEIPLVAEMLADLYTFTEGTSTTADAQLATAGKFAETERFRVWRAPGGEIAACAMRPHAFAGSGAVNAVYTRPATRGRGYAGAVVEALCRQMLDEGLKLMLYTNADYPSSNRAYEKIGFAPVGELVQIERR